MEKKIVNREELVSMAARHSNTIYRIALTHTKSEADAEDVVQEVFLRYLKNVPVFENAEHEKAWFIRVTVNVSRSLQRSAWRRHWAALDRDIAAPSQEPVSGVRPEVLRLPEKYRIVIHLFYYEGYSIREISKITGIKENTVKTNLRRAKKLLRERLGEQYEGF